MNGKEISWPTEIIEENDEHHKQPQGEKEGGQKGERKEDK